MKRLFLSLVGRVCDVVNYAQVGCATVCINLLLILEG